MNKFIVVETEEDKIHLSATGIDNLATILVSSNGAAISLTSSLAMTDDTYAVYVVETPSAEARFFKDWLVDADYLAGRAINNSQGSILPASPSIGSACRDATWVHRLKQRLEGNRQA
ncbi:hypothetical protein O9X98_06555 [Agrobacterium salinitolerans]|nr:hypothetical protein [Agrobacterium salinitolerans]